MLRLLLFAGALLSAQPVTTYHNARFGFSLAYPQHLLIPQGESDNGDGRRFVSKDKTFQVAAWGGYNALEQTLPEACQWHINLEIKERRFKLTYKVVKDGWYVYSGLSGGNIVYQKSFLRDGTFTTVRLEYPLVDKDKLDAAVKRIVTSLTPGR